MKTLRSSALACLVLLLLLTPSLSQDKTVVARRVEELEGGKGSKYAVIVGIDDYLEAGLASLKFAANDARDFYQLLADPHYGGFPKDNVKLMTPEAEDPNDLPTRDNILGRVANWLAQARKGDTVLFYFSGHGVEENRRHYLITTSTKPDLLADTGLASDRILELMEQSGASKRILILDSCYSGAKGGELMGESLAQALSESEGWVKLASCEKDERSYERKDVPYSVFTYALLRGLTGQADENTDGLITATELNQFAYKEVTRWAAENNVKQTPHWTSDISGDIVLSLAGGGLPAQETAGPLPAVKPSPPLPIAPLPKGKIAFTSNRDGNWEIYVMNSDGTRQMNLSVNPAADYSPSWSPNGTKIAFTSTGSPTTGSGGYGGGGYGGYGTGGYGGGYGTGAPSSLPQRSYIYVMDSDGSNQTCLSSLTQGMWADHSPSWSPDASQIVFISTRLTGGPGMMRPGGGYGGYGGGYGGYANPGGGYGGSASRPHGNGQIYVVGSDGSQAALTYAAADYYTPSWSPDGSKIAFASTGLPTTGFAGLPPWMGTDPTATTRTQIYVINPDGTNQTRLTNSPAWDGFPSWSPDGAKIAFTSNRDANLETPSNWEIYVMNSDGTNQTRLTDNPAWDGSPCWSPDGSKIAFASNRDGHYQIYVMRSDGTNQTNITNSPADDGYPSWSPF